MKMKWLTIGIILLFLGSYIIPSIAQDAEKPPKDTMIMKKGTLIGSERQIVLYDNGLPDGMHGFSCFFDEGHNRETCDDFYAYDSWSISGGQFRVLTGEGYGLESIAGVNVIFYPDNSGSPSTEPIVIYTVNCTGWLTGQYIFNRPVVGLNVTFGPLTLANGIYWVVFQPIRLFGDNVFVLSSPGMPGNELYFSYPDAGYPKWTSGHTIFSDFYYGYSFFLIGLSDNEPPIATFTYTSSDLSVTFNATSSYDPDGTIAAWRWDYGDGTEGEGETVPHNYSTSGTYNVTLTVVDTEGAKDNVTRQISIETLQRAFIFGEITNLSVQEEHLHFEMIKTRVITFSPFSFNLSGPGQNVTILKYYLGWVGTRYIVALCKILI